MSSRQDMLSHIGLCITSLATRAFAVASPLMWNSLLMCCPYDRTTTLPSSPWCRAAPQYLSDQLQYVADLTTRRRGRLRSSTSSILDVRPSRCVTVGDRSFATAGPRLWNSLPVDVRSASSLTFHRKLKTHLFRQSYPDIVL